MHFYSLSMPSQCESCKKTWRLMTSHTMLSWHRIGQQRRYMQLQEGGHLWGIFLVGTKCIWHDNDVMVLKRNRLHCFAMPQYIQSLASLCGGRQTWSWITSCTLATCISKCFTQDSYKFVIVVNELLWCFIMPLDLRHSVPSALT
jgi:hypothetical protein